MRRGELVILPTDTVYGLAATAVLEEPVRALYALKGRAATDPSALLAPDLELLFEVLPELRGRAEAIARTLLPGPYTLVLPNPARRFHWLTGKTPAAIGIRVPALPEPTASIVRSAGAVAATSANLPGGLEPTRLQDVPDELKHAVAAVVDGGDLPGIPSTVIDFTSSPPRVLREGAANGEEAIGRALAATA
jgi:L-threonylcarbamoyladenylate synthase